jgi:D-alanine-D-alanine ligase
LLFLQTFLNFIVAKMKKAIAIIAGGDSSEADVSVKSAEQLSKMIDNNMYDIFIISITGLKWVGASKGIEGLPVNKEDFSITVNNSKLKFDCAFISIHGTPGENGLLQSYFELLRIPYTSSGVLSSALTFNKYFSKNYLATFGIPYAKTFLFKRVQDVDQELLLKHVGLPCFVKPNEAGSSFGVSKVNRKEELIPAINEAFKEDNEVLVEEYIKGTEITCGIVKINKREIIFPITEIVSKSKSAFFDLEAKYQGLSEEITPARLPDAIADDCRKMTSKIYDLFDCKGIVRIDYIVRNGICYFLEVNSVPGMTQESIIPQQIRAMGMEPTEIFTLVIEDAINRM